MQSSVLSNGICRERWFAPLIDTCGIEGSKRQTLYSMVEGSDKRLVGKSALLNVIVRLQSLKNRQARLLESHTCELLFAYELEMDPSVRAYACQVPCRSIERRLKNGGRHVSSAHLDFLVFGEDTIEMVECKKVDWLQHSGQAHGWLIDNGNWRHEAYERFASSLGIGFRLWTPPSPAGTYQQNLELCYAALMDVSVAVPEGVRRGIHEALATGDRTLSELERHVPGFACRHAAILLSKGEIFGTLASASLNDTERFVVGGERSHMRYRDELALAENFLRYIDNRPESALALASQTNMAKALHRRDWLQKVARGEAPSTRRSRELQVLVDGAIAKGKSPLEALLSQYHRCGNRSPRLDTEVEQEIDETIDDCWLTGAIQRPIDLYNELSTRCEAKALSCPSMKKIWKALQVVSKERVALATGGKRAFHAARSSSDPLTRSLRPLAFGQVVHVDSTDLDNRHAPDLLEFIPEGRARIYYALDSGTLKPAAHVFIFGPARTDGLALLHRDYVRRHGREPGMYHFDRGPENKSHWVNALCEGHTHVRWSPAGGSQFNSQIEAAIKQINHQVAQRLIGSTLPDRAGRSVDGKFKSRMNAKTSFEDISRLIETFLYEDYANEEGEDGLSPNQRRQEAVNRWGEFGRIRAVDEDLLFETSVPMKIGRRVVANKGIRTEEGFFVSTELTRLLAKAKKVDDIRADPGDPSYLYVRLGPVIVKAYHSQVQSYAQLTAEARLFERLWSPIGRSLKREAHRRIGLKRHRRNRAQNAETTARWAARTSLVDAEKPDDQESHASVTTATDDWDDMVEYGVDDEIN